MGEVEQGCVRERVRAVADRMDGGFLRRQRVDGEIPGGYEVSGDDDGELFHTWCCCEK